MDGREPFDVFVGLLCSLHPVGPLQLPPHKHHRRALTLEGAPWRRFQGLLPQLHLLPLPCHRLLLLLLPQQEEKVFLHTKCYFYISDACYRCILCTNNVKKINSSHNSKCKTELEEEYNEIPDSPAFLCGKCNAPFKIWPKEKLALLHSLWCIKCEQVIIRSVEQNVHVCFLCDKMLCGLHIRPRNTTCEYGQAIRPGNTGRITVHWELLENLHTNTNYQNDLFIPPTASSSRAQGTEPSFQNRDNNPPGYTSSGPTTSPRQLTPSAPPVQHSSRLGFNPLPTETSMDHQSILLPRVPAGPEGSSQTPIYHELPPSYDVAMQDSTN